MRGMSQRKGPDSCQICRSLDMLDDDNTLKQIEAPARLRGDLGLCGRLHECLAGLEDGTE